MNETFEAAYKFGTPIIYSIILLFFVYKFAWRILDNYDAREKAYSNLLTNGLTGVTNALAELNKSFIELHHAKVMMSERLSKDIKEGFERMLEANKYQREEHKEIIDKIADSECRAEK